MGKKDVTRRGVLRRIAWGFVGGTAIQAGIEINAVHEHKNKIEKKQEQKERCMRIVQYLKDILEKSNHQHSRYSSSEEAKQALEQLSKKIFHSLHQAPDFGNAFVGENIEEIEHLLSEYKTINTDTLHTYLRRYGYILSLNIIPTETGYALRSGIFETQKAEDFLLRESEIKKKNPTDHSPLRKIQVQSLEGEGIIYAEHTDTPHTTVDGSPAHFYTTSNPKTKTLEIILDEQAIRKQAQQNSVPYGHHRKTRIAEAIANAQWNDFIVDKLIELDRLETKRQKAIQKGDTKVAEMIPTKEQLKRRFLMLARLENGGNKVEDTITLFSDTSFFTRESEWIGILYPLALSPALQAILSPETSQKEHRPGDALQEHIPSAHTQPLIREDNKSVDIDNLRARLEELDPTEQKRILRMIATGYGSVVKSHITLAQEGYFEKRDRKAREAQQRNN